LADVPEPDADRQRDQRGDRRRGERQLDVHPGQLPDLAEPADLDGAGLRLALMEDEVDRVSEGTQRGEHGAHDATARSHGVQSHCTTSTISSRAVASRIISSDAVTTLPLKAGSLKISPPSPPAPAKNAKPAMPTVDEAAIRRPAKIVGSAIGSSTRHRIWRRVRPIPWATSTVSAGTSCRPVMTLR